MRDIFIKKFQVPEQEYHILLIQEFYRLIVEYRKRSFTFQSDKLAATAGLAQIVEQKLQGRDRYYAGLWDSNWTLGLYWGGNQNLIDCSSLNSTKKSTIPFMPSWSWASVIASHYYGFTGKGLRSFVTDVEPPQVENDQDRFIPREPLVLRFTVPFQFLSDTWTELPAHIDSGSTDLALLGFEKILRQHLYIEGNANESDTSRQKREENFRKTEYSQKHRPYPGQHFAVIRVLELKVFSHAGQFDSEHVLRTFFLVLESVEENPSWYRRVASLNLPRLFKHLQSPTMECEGRLVYEGEILEMVRDLPWQNRRIQLV
ncbi:hypothetical protein VKT23_013457 [Stygiomarasmius scandens]|uniref:Uncharacterized protein n=1 Tax=Marasmiellus scandens TaxID=2682957 RepID=A0ABR1J638_9AGAR